MAVLVFGLNDNSRIKKRYSNSKISVDQILMAMVVDDLNFLAWTKTRDAKHGKYKQKSILKTLQGEYDTKKEDLISFKTVEEYEEYMKQFIR